jgi:hypothetical protein
MSKLSSILVLGLSLALLSCRGTQQIPRWEGKIYAGDPDERAMVRRQAGEVIPADSEAFRGLMGMKWQGPDGFEGFYRTYVLGCKEWKQETLQKGVMTLEEANWRLTGAKRTERQPGDPRPVIRR